MKDILLSLLFFYICSIIYFFMNIPPCLSIDEQRFETLENLIKDTVLYKEFSTAFKNVDEAWEEFYNTKENIKAAEKARFWTSEGFALLIKIQKNDNYIAYRVLAKEIGRPDNIILR